MGAPIPEPLPDFGVLSRDSLTDFSRGNAFKGPSDTKFFTERQALFTATAVPSIARQYFFGAA